MVANVAAAATGVVMRATSVRRTVNFIANRPFVWAIRDKTTGHLLFLGRITDPTQQ